MIIWTHRGNPGVENTLEGFKQAWGAGIRHFETDIHLTKDGVIVLSHDPDISRLSTSSQLINELTFDELQQFPVEGSHSWARLEDLIDAFPEAHISIDLKCDEVVIPFVEFAKGKNYSKWVVGSFSTSRVKHVRTHFPDLLTALTPREVLFMVLGIKHSGIKDGLHYAMVPPTMKGIRIVTKRFVKRCHKFNIKVFVWTINSKDELRKLSKIGVDGVVSDVFPHLLEAK
jgi:glycerophosphoryl diester phosphodiesterase